MADIFPLHVNLPAGMKYFCGDLNRAAIPRSLRFKQAGAVDLVMGRQRSGGGRPFRMMDPGRYEKPYFRHDLLRFPPAVLKRSALAQENNGQ